MIKRYVKVFNKLRAELRAFVAEVYIGRVDAIRGQYLAKDDAETDTERLAEETSAAVGVASAAAVVTMTEVVKLTGARHTTKWKRIVKRGAGVDLTPFVNNNDLRELLSLFTNANARLITNVSDDFRAFIAATTVEYINGAMTKAAFISAINKKLKGVKTRGEFIATDQLIKLNSELSKYRQLEAGIEEYIWRTVGDERVRPTHRENNSLRFRWDRPPATTGHPGHDPRCRCTPEAVIQ